MEIQCAPEAEGREGDNHPQLTLFPNPVATIKSLSLPHSRQAMQWTWLHSTQPRSGTDISQDVTNSLRTTERNLSTDSEGCFILIASKTCHLSPHLCYTSSKITHL